MSEEEFDLLIKDIVRLLSVLRSPAKGGASLK